MTRERIAEFLLLATDVANALIEAQSRDPTAADVLAYAARYPELNPYAERSRELERERDEARAIALRHLDDTPENKRMYSEGEACDSFEADFKTAMSWPR